MFRILPLESNPSRARTSVRITSDFVVRIDPQRFRALVNFLGANPRRPIYVVYEDESFVVVSYFDDRGRQRLSKVHRSMIYGGTPPLPKGLW